MINMFYVYVLKCRDGSFYTGYTNDLEKRVTRRNDGNAAKYTRARRPVMLATKWQFPTQREAMQAEAKFKTLSRKEKIKRIQENNNL